jgi:hypothetical protein
MVIRRAPRATIWSTTIGGGIIVVGFWTGLLVPATDAQMVVVESPLQTGTGSFYERMGVGFSFNLPGSNRLIGLNPNGSPTADGSIPFRVGGFGTVPAFGGYDPNADSTFGLGYRFGRGGAINLNFAFGQGANQTYTSTNPSIVIMNGSTGFVSDTRLRPFVTSIIPVVGQGGLPEAPAAARGGAPRPQAWPPAAENEAPTPRSSAETGDLSVAEIRRARQQAQQSEVDELLTKARLAAMQQKPASARVYLRNALRRTEGTEQHSQILAEFAALLGQRNASSGAARDAEPSTE